MTLRSLSDLGKLVRGTMTFDFTGKKILVTGAGKGIGRALVKALVGAGAEVFALSRTKETLDSLEEEAPGIHPMCIDLSDWATTRTEVDKLGPLDGLVNNAGLGQGYISALEISQEVIENMLKVNLLAAINVTQSVGKKMVAAGKGGSIVNVSSIVAVNARREQLAYNVSKAGLDMVSKQFSLELGPHKVRVNSVNPTMVLTPLVSEAYKDSLDELLSGFNRYTPLGRTAEVHEVVDLIMFMLSDQSTMISGEAMRLDGGLLSNIPI